MTKNDEMKNGNYTESEMELGRNIYDLFKLNDIDFTKENMDNFIEEINEIVTKGINNYKLLRSRGIESKTYRRMIKWLKKNY